ncbi:hypothetical protein NVP3058O_078 [Vibrio phage 3.058.O._10N.286.46.B8]|nr:hypothetical protein NVP2058O_079 [Vibrio phage 2.058.O._10N.286.46.B8]AUS03148.1 hypothetical protein NVP3058O_078 [Vibrio phage 3.058.O._10N.286.46.B8]
MKEEYERNLRIRKLIKNIIDIVEETDIDLKKPFFGKNTKLFHEMISKLSGVKADNMLPSPVMLGVTGIYDTTSMTKWQYPNCQEVYVYMLYPSISIKEYGDMQFGDYKLGEFMEALMHTRNAAKKMFPNSNISLKVKCLINYVYSFIQHSDLEWANEYMLGVVHKGREIIANVTKELATIPDVYPIMVKTDMVIVSSFEEKGDLSKLITCVPDYRLISENIHDVVIIDKIRYIEGGKANGFALMNNHGRIQTSTKRLVDRIINEVK